MTCKRLLRRLIPLCVLTAAAGCGPDYDRLDITKLTTPPGAVSLQQELRLSLGTIAVVHVRPRGKSGRYDSDTPVGLSSKDPTIMDVRRAAKRHGFALIGVNPGTTCIEVKVDGEREECIPARVLDDAR